ncbi:DNA polymerase III subunit delta' [Legionella sp.]|uniref:DNA polymerase III subunit delta' n=1 Tax=Legionella sp. TaxID=459 RepID=UPI003C953E5A
MNTYKAQWDYLHSAWMKERYPQAMLFVGAFDGKFLDFTTEFIQLIFCKSKEGKPCHDCIDCQMTRRGEHPDVKWIKPEKCGGSIKIDQIRELQNYSYLTPQRAAHRLIIIQSSDRMNTAAANALLKILEEPAKHTLFLLMAQQLSTVLPTVLSRCQILRFSLQTNLSTMNLLSLGHYYTQETQQALIINQAESILEGLIAVIEKKEHPCVIATQWTQFELNTMLWFLYLVYSQVEITRVYPLVLTGPAIKQLSKLTLLLNPMIIFAQIDKINKLQRKLSQNINVNHTLALEDLLFDL